ncbi:MAG: hypothetical protein EBZ48_03700 [Proteobacteria bacterium]|nr:hypothetical protein [Pseudomonadota bacterium]
MANESSFIKSTPRIAAAHQRIESAPPKKGAPSCRRGGHTIDVMILFKEGKEVNRLVGLRDVDGVKKFLFVSGLWLLPQQHFHCVASKLAK